MIIIQSHLVLLDCVALFTMIMDSEEAMHSLWSINNNKMNTKHFTCLLSGTLKKAFVLFAYFSQTILRPSTLLLDVHAFLCSALERIRII